MFVVPVVLSGVTWPSVKDDYVETKKKRVHLHIMKENGFISASGIRVDLIRRIGRRVAVYKVQRRLVLAGYCSRHPDKWHRLTPDHRGTISTGSMWYLPMSPRPTSTTLIILFLECNNPLNFQEDDETFEHDHCSFKDWLGLISKYRIRTVQMIPVGCLCVNMWRHW